MRISIPILNNVSTDSKDILSKLKEGDTIKGRIVEVNGDTIKIDLGNGNIVQGKTEVPLDLLEKEFMNFVIKDISGNTLVLSPVYDDVNLENEYFIKNQQVIMEKILEFHGLEKSQKNIDILKVMIGYKMPLDKENVSNIIKHINKLESLLNTQSNEKIHMISTNQDPLKENILKFLKINQNELQHNITNKVNAQTNLDVNSNNKMMNINSSNNTVSDITSLDYKTPIIKDNNVILNDEFIPFEKITNDETILEKNKVTNINTVKDDMPQKININNTLNDNKNIEGKVVDLVDLKENLNQEKTIKDQNNDVTNKESLNHNYKDKMLKDVTDIVLKEIKNLFSSQVLDKKSMQKVVFLLKSNIEANIQNLKTLENVLNKGETINKSISELAEELEKEGLITKEIKDRLVLQSKSVEINFDGSDKERIGSFYKKLNDNIEKIIHNISGKDRISDELMLKVKNASEKIEFFNRINEKSMLLCIPFTLNKNEMNNTIYLLSKRRINKKSDSIKVYISLDTKKFDKVKILCDYMYSRLNVNFNIDKKYVEIFENRKNELKQSLNENSYDNVFIYVNSEKNKDILDIVSYDDTINYMVNIKV
ncbi:hypothetical protein CLPU_5c01010 [Gottschalkia purinilytica]|uniref:Flagellar hook-length control protein FliK n=1 Tax=Gottschalkia purinilytica TaxID=1503 RepID=A0A0L0WB90_GOTPU|nr:hypothetical protein [Gottschalkia purinilytica]KNF08794.1 hypothetical protein CLPU_5c01010 [Gottschalkia purinilytica]